MRIISRSSHQAFRQCPRKFYYGYVKDGTGYAGKGTSLDLILGLAVHTGLEILLKTGDIENAVQEALARYDEEAKASWPSEGMEEEKAQAHAFHIEEWHFLAEALVRGWHRVRYPIFVERYEVVDIEKERRTPLAPNVILASRGDILVRDKATADLILFNWKTTSSTKDWDVKWHWDVQAWTETLAEEYAKGERVSGCLFEGLYKGVRKDNRQCTSLLYGYTLPGDDPQYRVDYVKPSKVSPWARFKVWEEKAFGGEPIKWWINWLPWNEVSQYFITSNPVMKNDQVMEKWIQQVVRLETEIEHMLREEVTEEERLTYFIQNFSWFSCGRCQFNKICKGEATLEESIAQGRFVPRIDHHGETPQDGD